MTKWIWRAGALISILALSACAATYRNHGYVPDQEDLELIVVGIDTRATVEDTVGPPTSAALINESGYYYVRSRVKTLGFRAPEEIERTVLAISFDDAGVVANIERFTLEDGIVVPLERRVTETSVRDQAFLRQLLGNLGRVSPAAFGN